MSVTKSVLVWLCVLGGALGLGGCNRAEQKQARRQLTEFERDMVTVKNGGFAHVYVFARKDGQSLQTDDKSFLKAHPPDDVNSMWLLTDSERRVILGTNVDFTPENLGALTKRFTAEDYTNWSPPR
ncbi:MAG: hypothetical protein ACJ74W_19795 [Pyrinomonadaceae bacterium]